MKTMVLIFIMAIILIATSVYAEEPSANVIAAGQMALAEKDSNLSEIAILLDDSILKAVWDRKISESEVSTFCYYVNSFHKEKKKADRYLKIYNLQTTVTLDPRIEEFVSLYQKPFFNNGTRYKDQMRHILADLTGQDIIAIDFTAGSFMPYLFPIISIGIIILSFSLIEKTKSTRGKSILKKLIIVGIILFIVSIGGCMAGF